MKYIIIMLLTITLYADSIILPYGSFHTDRNKGFNEFNYGLGYSYEIDDCSIDFLAIKDSYGHLMLSATYTKSYEVIDDLYLGYSVGIGYRNVRKDYINFDDSITPVYKYRMIPVASLLATVPLTNKINIVFGYIPNIQTDTSNVYEVVYSFIAIKI